MKKNLKAVIAILAAAILVLLYAATLLAACLNIPGWDRLFQACLVATIGLPILLWVYLLIFKWWKSQTDIERNRDKDNY